MIDSLLKKYGKIAIRCRSRSEVHAFASLFNSINTDGYYLDADYFSGEGYDELGDQFCFRLIRYGSSISWGYDSFDYYNKCGYKVIEYSELFLSKDLGDIPESEQSIFELFSVFVEEK